MQKLYYSISEASDLIGEEQHVLRYWEKEFKSLTPKKNRKGNRVYSERDLLTLQTIKRLLRDDKLSLKGAKEKLSRIIDEDSANLLTNPEPKLTTEPTHQQKIAMNGIFFSNEEVLELIGILKGFSQILK